MIEPRIGLGPDGNAFSGRQTWISVYQSEVLRLTADPKRFLLPWFTTAFVMLTVAAGLVISSGYINQFGLYGSSFIGAMIGQIPILVWASSAGAIDFDNGTAAETFIAVPRRSRLSSARVLASSSLAAVCIFIISFACVLIAYVVGRLRDLEGWQNIGQAVELVGTQTGSTVALVGFATALGLITRSRMMSSIIVLLICQVSPFLATLSLNFLEIDTRHAIGLLPLVRFGAWDIGEFGPSWWLGVGIDFTWTLAVFACALVTIDRDLN